MTIKTGGGDAVDGHDHEASGEDDVTTMLMKPASYPAWESKLKGSGWSALFSSTTLWR